MNIKSRIVLITVSVSLLIWAICAVLALTLFRQTGFATNITSSQVILITSTFIIVLMASIIVSNIMSRIMAQRSKALEEFKESEERLRALSSATIEGVIIHDGNIFLEANDISARMLGLEPSEIRGKSFADFIVPEYLEVVMKHFHDSYTEPYEVYLRRKNGSVFPVELCGRDATCKGKKVRVLSIRNMTQNKRADEELRFRGDLLDACSDSIILHDYDGVIIYVNEAACRSHGYARDEIMRINFRNLTVSESGPILRPEIEEVEKKGDVIFESAHYRKDGSILPLEIHARTFKWSGKEFVLSVGRDITERKKAEAELRFRSELLDACSDSLLWTDADGKFIYINEPACRAHGYTHDEMMNVNINKLIIPEFSQIAQSKIGEVLKTGDVIFECAHYRKDGSILPLEIHAHTFKMGEEDHVLTICRDITERKQAEELLKNITANSPSSTFIIQDEKFQFVNPRMIESTGYSETELMAMPTDKIIYPEDRQKVRGEVTKVLAGEPITSCEYRGVRKDGSIIWSMGSIVLIKYRGRRAILGTVADLTEQKETEEELRFKGELLDACSDPIFWYDTDGNPIFFNDATCRIHGYTRDEMMKINIRDLIVPEYARIVPLKIEEIASKGDAIFESAHYRKDGSILPLEIHAHVFKLRGLAHTLSICRDITERKKREMEKEQNAQFLQVLIDSIPLPVFYKDINGVFLGCNTVYSQFIGIEKENIIGKTAYQTAPKELADVYYEKDKELFNNPGTQVYEYKATDAEGKIRDVIFNKATFPNPDGSIGGLVGAIQDITERKRVEEALRLSEMNFRNSMDNSPLGVRIEGAGGETTYTNRRLLDIYGYKNMEEYQSKSPKERLTPESYQAFLAFVSKEQRGEPNPEEYEISIIRTDGSIRHLEVFRKKVFWDSKYQFQMLFNDITERKQAEEALKASEQNFRNSMDSSSMGINIVDTDFNILYVNQALLDIFGYKNIDALKANPPAEHYTFESYAGWVLRHEKLLRGEPIPDKVEIDIIRTDGAIRHLEIFRKEVFWDGKIQYQTLYNDITERKLAETALKASEERFRRLAENIPDVITRFRFVPSRGYEYVSPSSTIVTGYTPEEYYANPELGTEMIYPEDKGLQQTMAEKPEFNKGIPLITRYVRKDGRIIWVERRQIPISDENGQLIALEAIDRDVTEDIRMEEALRMSETNFRNSMDNSPLGIRIESTGNETIYANHKLLEMYGYENLSEFRSKKAQERLTPESYRGYVAFLEKEQRGEYTPQNYEVTIIRKDGSIRHLEAFRKKVLWGGEPQFQVIYNDVTEQKHAEEAIHASEENLRSSLDNSLVGIRISDVDNYTLYANQSLMDIFGYNNLDEVKAIPPQKFYTPESYNYYQNMRKQFRRNEPMPDQVDIDIVRKDGDVRHLQALFKVILWDGKQQYQTIYNDITARKQAEQALKRSEKKYRELVETAQEGIMIIDADSYITFVNQRLCEMHGYSESELVGKYVYDSMDEKGKTILKKELNQRRLGIKGEYDTEFIHKNGTHIQARVGATPLYDDNGNYAGVMAVIVDISALKQAEERILHLNSVLNALRGIAQLITLENDRGNLLRESCDLLVKTRGYDTAWLALTDDKGKFVSGVSCGIDSKVFKTILKNFTKGKYLPCTHDLLNQKEDTILCPQVGSQHPDCPLSALGDNLCNLSGRLEYEGKLYGVLSVQLPSKLAVDKEEQALFKELTSDIAFALDRLEKENQLLAAEAKALEAEKLQEVDRLRSELLANVSHELRTPLASIKGYTSTLLRTDVKWSAKQHQDFLETIDVETDRLTKLINDILEMSRIEGGALKLRLEQNNVSEILGPIMSRLKILAEHHQLKIKIPNKLPAVFVDGMRIGQVISNLVDNATKFSPQGSEISISAHRDKNQVIVSVTDHGKGMTKDVTQKLFNRFYQAEDVVTGRKSGTGLGLAISRGIIESHGGQIWVESQVGVGSTFNFSLPVWKEGTHA